MSGAAIDTRKLSPAQKRALREALLARRAGRPREMPPSFGQRRLWLLDRLAPGDPAYNVPAALTLAGRLDPSALERALTEVVRRHEVLRTTFRLGDGDEPVAVIHPPGLGPGLPVVDLSGLTEAQRHREAARRTEAVAVAPFDLERGPIVRARLLRLTADEHRVLLTLHHIVCDEWSLAVLLEEVTALYGAYVAGRPSPLAPLPIQYADYALWQRERLTGETVERLLADWRQRLEPLPAPLAVPADRPRPAVKSSSGATVGVEVPAEVAAGLRELSRGSRGASLFMVLLAAFQAYLARLSGQHRLLVGTPVAGRDRREVEGLIGFFVNTVVVPADLGDDPTFETLLGTVRETVLDAFDQQEMPFEMLVDHLGVERDLSRSPLFQVLFVFQSAHRSAADAAGRGGLPGLDLDHAEVATGTAKFDLTLSMSDHGGRLTGFLEFSRDLFDPATARRLADGYARWLARVVAEPGRRLSELDLVGDAERRLLDGWAAGPPAVATDGTVHGLLLAAAAESPEAPAVVAGDERLDFAGLAERSERWARHLLARGVRRDDRVAIVLERSIDLVVALVAVLRAGGAYLPVDLDTPEERLDSLLADADPRLAIARRDLAGVETIEPTALDAALESDADPELPVVGPDQLAYVLYTSGSTGRPKGVLVPHRGVVAYLAWAREAYGAERGEGSVVHSSVAFDLTVTSLLLPLAAGRSVELVGEAPGIEPLAEALEERRGLSLVKLTPAHLDLLSQRLSPEAATDAAHTWVVGGEELSADTAARWLRATEGARLVNEYGPTETVVGCVAHFLGGDDGALPESGRAVPIGRPIAGAVVRVVDRRFRPVPVGVFGELVVGGAGVTRGYLGRPGLTAERFVPDPFGQVRGRRLYRTGDLVRFRDEGRLEYGGRIDRQMKIRGHRVEPGEIEAVLAAQPGVDRAVVVARPTSAGHLRLVAYLTAGAEATPTVEEVRLAASRQLPAHMVPGRWVLLDELPLTAHGKVDRAALPDDDDGGEREVVAPRTPVEAILAELWGEVLGIATPGVTDSFFTVGGDSILAVQLATRARRRGLDLDPRDLFRFQTIEELAAVAEGRRDDGADIAAGPVPATAVEEAFLDAGAAGVEVRALSLATPVEPVTLARLLGVVAASHEVFRLRFVPPVDGEPAGRRSLVDGPDGGTFPLAVADLDALPAARREAEVARLGGLWAAGGGGVEADRGPLARALLCRPGRSDAATLGLAVHRAAADGRSWGLLLEELELGHAQMARGLAPVLPEESLPARRWAGRTPGPETPPLALRLPGGGERSTSRVDLADGPVPWSLVTDALGRTLAIEAGDAWRLVVLAPGRESVGGPDPSRTMGALVRPETRAGSDIGTDTDAGETVAVLDVATLPTVPTLHGSGHGRLAAGPAIHLGGPRPVLAIAGVSGWSLSAETTPEGAVLHAVAPEGSPADSADFVERWADRLRQLAGRPESRVVEQEQPLVRLDARQLDGVVADVPALEDLYPATPLQGAMVALTLARPGTQVGVEQLASTLVGRLDRDAFETAWRKILDRHPVLRTSFVWEGLDIPLQRVHRGLDLPLSVEDWRDVEGDEQMSAADHRRRRLGEFLAEDLRQGFDLARPPLLRLMLIVLGDEEQVVVWTHHHALMDGWCRSAVLAELLDVYEALVGGRPLVLPPPRPYRDYLAWLAERDPGVSDRFWYSELAGLERATRWRFERPSEGDDRSERFGRESFRLDAGLSERVAAFARARRLTVNSLIQGAWALVLSRATDTDDLVFGSIVSGRPAEIARVETMVGLFMNILPVRVVVEPEASVADWLATHQERQAAARDHESAPLERILTESPLPSDVPLFESLMVFENFPLGRRAGGGAGAQDDGSVLEVHGVEGAAKTNFPVTVLLRPGPGGLAGQLVYDARRVPSQGAGRLVVELLRLVEALIADPDRSVGEVMADGAPGSEVDGVTVVDRHDRPALEGVPGRLVGAGDDGDDGDRVGRWRRTDGGGRELVVLGRTEDRVTVPGFGSVGLWEIETPLAAAPEIGSVVALPRTGGSEGLEGLALWVEPAPGAEAPTPWEVATRLRRLVPGRLLPDLYLVAPDLPRGADGSVDRAAAAREIERHPERWAPASRPRNVIEARLLDIFREVLDRRRLWVTDDFFELGGNSILALRVMARVREDLGQDLPLSIFFRGSTIEDLALLLREEIGYLDSPLVPIQPRGELAPLALVHPVGGSVIRYNSLVPHLNPERPVYGLEARHRSFDTLEEMARNYCDALEERLPEGPLVIGGWSYGGVVAYQMAWELEERGRRPEMVALFDSPAPQDGLDDDAATDLDPRVPGGLVRLLEQTLERPLPVDPDELAGLPTRVWQERVLDVAKEIQAVPRELSLDEALRDLTAYQTRLRLARDYRPPRGYSGRVVVFRCQDLGDMPDALRRVLDEDPAMGWSPLVDGPVGVVPVPGRHAHLLSPPAVGVLGERLRERLAQLRTQ